ncbi:MAG: hypothetical protein JNM14_13880 [Ferruginibacter sp.]|nr:hypothetical protein [Ferruginibacter sp.]
MKIEAFFIPVSCYFDDRRNLLLWVAIFTTGRKDFASKNKMQFNLNRRWRGRQAAAS